VFILFIDSRIYQLIISRIQRPLGLHPFSPCDVMMMCYTKLSTKLIVYRLHPSVHIRAYESARLCECDMQGKSPVHPIRICY